MGASGFAAEAPLVVGLATRRLRARQRELERAVLARVREVAPDPAGEADAEYAAGLRATVAAAIDYGLTGIERGDRPVAVPAEVALQARRAARNGVALDAVLRRYIAGNALLWDYIMQEADRAELAGQGVGLRGMLQAQSSLLDKLVVVVAREYASEMQRAGRSGEQRLLERVRILLAGEPPVGVELDYQLDAEHLGVIGRGPGCQAALRQLAADLDRQLLSVTRGGGTVWAWLGGQRALQPADLQRLMSPQTGRCSGLSACRRDGHGGDAGQPPEVCFAVGEVARGLEGWRLTHRQAQAALLVALRKPQQLTRYSDVALLAATLQDETLMRSLRDMYLSPLENPGSAGAVLRHTLRAYLAAECNASSTAAVLRVVRSTVENRLRTIEERLGRSLHPCPPELEIALHLDDLGPLDVTDTATIDCDCD